MEVEPCHAVYLVLLTLALWSVQKLIRLVLGLLTQINKLVISAGVRILQAALLESWPAKGDPMCYCDPPSALR